MTRVEPGSVPARPQRTAGRFLIVCRLVCLALLPGAVSVSYAQTRPLVSAEDLAKLQAEQEARALAAARAWRFEPSIGTTVTATTNSGLSFASDTARDLIVDVEPRLVVRGRGASFTLEGNLGAKGLLYTQRSQENRILPTGTLSLNANLVDRWFYVDVSGLAEQIAADPYSVRADSDSSLNKINSFQYRFSPYLQHSFTPSLSLTARNDNIWTRRRGEFNDADPRRNSVVNNNTVLFEQRPQPFGFSLEGKQEETRYLTGQETVLKTASGRAVASYALDPTFVVGLVGGRERSEYALSTTTDVISGFRVRWAPTERSEIRGTYERRYFGNGGTLQWTHRSPFVAFSLNASREPNALGTSFLLNPNAGSVQSLLDAIYTTRYPDPVERAAIVNSVIAGLGIPSTLGGAVEVFADYAQLRDSLSASAVFQGVRTTVTTRVFSIKSRQLTQEGAPFVPLAGQADNAQNGLSIDMARRLTATLTMEVGAGYATAEGLGIAALPKTKSASLKVGFAQALSPKTRITLGTRFQRTDITGPGQDATADELAAFVGMAHRF